MQLGQEERMPRVVVQGERRIKRVAGGDSRQGATVPEAESSACTSMEREANFNRLGKVLFRS